MPHFAFALTVEHGRGFFRVGLSPFRWRIKKWYVFDSGRCKAFSFGPLRFVTSCDHPSDIYGVV